MIIYLLKSSICLGVFLLFYKLFLENENMHIFKRFYLLGTTLAAFLIPLVIFTEYVEVAENVQNTILTIQETPIKNHIARETTTTYATEIIWTLYAIGVLIFGFIFLKNLSILIQRIRKNPKYKSRNIIFVLLGQPTIPHTFFNYIFLNQQKFEAKEIPNAVLLHEETHAKQKHSIDLLTIELLQVVFWFNPLLIILKKSIKLNHEFLADQAVVAHGVSTDTYQHILLAFSSNALAPQFSNSINYSSIKKRFTVMKTKTSRKSVVLRSILLLPLFSLLLYGFSETHKVVRNIGYNKVEARSNGQETNNTKAMLQDSSKISKEEYYKNVVFKFRDKNSKVVVSKRYDELSLEEQEKLVPPLSKISANNPSKAHLHDWHDENKFGIWLDGKRIANNELAAYDPQDIEMYSVSKLAKNAKNYGKHYYQVNLFSKKGFDESFPIEIKPLEKGVVILLSVDAIESYQKSSSETIQILISKNGQLLLQDNQVVALKDLKTQLLKLNTHLSKKERDQIVRAKIVPAMEAPKSIVDDVVKILKEYGVAMINIDGAVGPPPPGQDGASREAMAEYNKLAKYYNAMPKNKMKILKKDVERLEYIYALMSDKQKDEAEPFPDFPDPPPAPEAPKPPKNVSDTEYAANQIEHIIDTQDPYDHLGVNINSPIPPLSPNETGVLSYAKALAQQDAQFYYEDEKITIKKGIEIIASKKNIVVETYPWVNEQPEVKIYSKTSHLKKGFATDSTSPKTIKIGNSHIPPPPTPEPKSPLDQVIEMAKQGAIFYYEDKEITSDKAIEIIKKNSKINIKTRDSKSHRPIVNISTE